MWGLAKDQAFRDAAAAQDKKFQGMELPKESSLLWGCGSLGLRIFLALGSNWGLGPLSGLGFGV